jgi:hypothetical protein
VADLSNRLFAVLALTSVEERDEFIKMALLTRIKDLFLGHLSEEGQEQVYRELTEWEYELSMHTVDDYLRSKLIEYGGLYACVRLRPDLVTQEHKDQLLRVCSSILH